MWKLTAGVTITEVFGLVSIVERHRSASYTFARMPTNGETIYVRLTTNYNGTWVQNDYVYTAH
jgi:hypothetical protein